jgi:hypothetical protein
VIIPKKLKKNDRFILTKQTNVRNNGAFEAVMDPAAWYIIDGTQYYVTVWRKMQFSGHHSKEFFTANAELTNAVLSEDGLTLRHSTVEPKQGDSTFGGMRIEDWNKDFVITIEMQTDVRLNSLSREQRRCCFCVLIEFWSPSSAFGFSIEFRVFPVAFGFSIEIWSRQ